MKTLLVAINAKYIHTNPAVRIIAARAEEAGIPEVSFLECTINQSSRDVLQLLHSAWADIYIFSCYIWNIEIIKSLSSDLRKLFPCAVITAAGPQVSFDPAGFLLQNEVFDCVISGEGEVSTPAFISALYKNGDIKDCPGLSYRKSGAIVSSSEPEPINMDNIPFAYGDIANLSGRILYYESMRGCPFSCSYCLSGAQNAVRTRNLTLVRRDLSRFLDANAVQVKFVDRTFNAVKSHAMAIWKYLIENDNGETNFHFEISGELIDEDIIVLLKKARTGLFQFEIGVQSCNEETLREIRRPFDFDRLSENVAQIQSAENIHIHLDLIAGLPYEDLDSFAKSFDCVYALRPGQLQLGFLKILSGSEMEKKAPGYGLIYSQNAPFEVLSTNWLNFHELCILHGISDMVETYYNSGRFSCLLQYVMEFFYRRDAEPTSSVSGEIISPFAFYNSLRAFYFSKGSTPSKLGYYDILHDFMENEGIPLNDKVRWLCKFDILRTEKPRKLPAWVNVDMSRARYGQILDFLTDEATRNKYLPQYAGTEPKHLARIVQVEIFPFHPVTHKEGIMAVLFDYSPNRQHFLEMDADNGKIR